jgi:transforming growth factor-beta-induced protein
MKNNLKSLALVAIVSIGIITVSCDKQDDLFQEQNVSLQDDNLKKASAKLAPGTQSIAEIAIEAGFTELVGALQYVDENVTPSPGLVNLFLNGKDQYTVFAPTNDAFMNLYTALGVEKISDLPADLVLNVLLYHVTDGRRASNSVVPPVKPRMIETLLSGSGFTVDKDGMITAVGNTAHIVSADISASNGVIHVIDAVILPIKP